jgi:hypothetical protein
LSGAPHGWLNFPTRGDFGSFGSESSVVWSLPVLKRVIDSRPTGWNEKSRGPVPPIGPPSR